MPLTGEYEPSAASWARDQVDLYERSGGTEGTEMGGRPVIILTSVGAKTGKIRKTPLMRVEHDGDYAVVASLGGAPSNPVWYYNLASNPRVELQDGPVKKDYQAREIHGLRRVPEEDEPDDPGLRAHACRRVTGAGEWCPAAADRKLNTRRKYLRKRG
jgi:F420H(2)-dependent quinone reductase